MEDPLKLMTYIIFERPLARVLHMGYKKLWPDRYLCPNHLANSLLDSAHYPVERGLPSTAPRLKLIEKAL